MKKPMIGVTPLWDADKEGTWMEKAYSEAVQTAGGIPMILPLKTDLEDIRRISKFCDGFLFTGGPDVDPALYRAETEEACGPLCPERDLMEAPLLKAVIEADRPALCVCRGHQLLNAVMGGTLYQDLKTDFPAAGGHRMEKPYDRTAHQAVLVQESPLAKLLGKEKIGVNSIHHQAVRCAAPGLDVMAWAEDGVNEACWCPDRRFLWSVQWHPELLFRKSPDQLKIFRAFVTAAAGGK